MMARRYILEGRVQGVGCRAQVLDLVEGIGHLSGWVRNLEDGKVEVAVKGPDWRVKDLERILSRNMNWPVEISKVTTLAETLENIAENGFRVKT